MAAARNDLTQQEELELHYELIASDADFSRAVASLAAGTGPIAVDTERASGFRYDGRRAYLVQMFRQDAGVFLFDPLAISDFAPLQAVLSEVEWILHAATQDFECLRMLGLNPQLLFDTEFAGRLLGFSHVNLGAMVAELLGIALEKKHSAVDWSTRPLPPEWLEYAAFDVRLLPRLRTALLKLLEEQNKLVAAQQEFAALLSWEPKQHPGEPWMRLKGVHQIRSPRQRAIAKELWEARDALAAERDIAPARLLPDSSIVAAAVANPRSRAELSRLPNFKGRASQSHAQLWWKAVRRGKFTDDLPQQPQLDPHRIPPPKVWDEKNPAAAARLAALRPALEKLAEQQKMAVMYVLPPEIMRRICWDAPASAAVSDIQARLRELGARPWQTELCAPIIATVFGGNLQNKE